MEKNSFGSYFPILIDLSRFKSLVIGGGNIATRKVYNLLEFNSLVTVISPNISEDLELLNKNSDIIWLKKPYEYGDIDTFDLVFAATANQEVDQEIHKECSEKKILLNVADVPELCNFIMPATIKRGDLTISIGSQGRAPFYVRQLKETLSEQFPELTSEEVELASLLRDKMIEYKIYYDIEKREKLIKDFFNIDWETKIVESGIPEAKAEILRLLNKYL